MTAPDEVDQLATLAEIWVDRWLTYGGFLVLTPGSASVGIGMRIRGNLWRSKHPFGQRLWHDGWQVGRWRELSELAALVPGLVEAISDHVARAGSERADGAIVMERSSAEMGVV